MNNSLKKKIQTKNFPTEVLLKKFVAKDVQSMLRPFNFMQNIIFCPKYGIKDNFIRPNSTKSMLISVFAALIFSAMYFYRNYYFFYFNTTAAPYSINVRIFFFVSETLFYSAGFLINTFIAVFRTRKNIEFVLIIQDLNITFRENLRRYTLRNWISVLTLVTFYVLYVLYTFLITPPIDNYAVWIIFLQSFFDLNIIYAIGLMKVLTQKAILWNKAISNLNNIRDEEVCKILFNSYDQMLKCYKIYRDSFGILVSSLPIKIINK